MSPDTEITIRDNIIYLNKRDEELLKYNLKSDYIWSLQTYVTVQDMKKVLKLVDEIKDNKLPEGWVLDSISTYKAPDIILTVGKTTVKYHVDATNTIEKLTQEIPEVINKLSRMHSIIE